MKRYRAALFAACLSALAYAAHAHHSYAMFDASGTHTVTGTVAKLEWKNPHAFIWIYVAKPGEPGKYDLWGFENGSPSVLQGHGWNKDVLKAGDKVSVEYWALRDGTIGGHCEKVTLAEGRVLQCPSDLGRRASLR